MGKRIIEEDNNLTNSQDFKQKIDHQKEVTQVSEKIMTANRQQERIRAVFMMAQTVDMKMKF